jgi:hypothetical protein
MNIKECKVGTEVYDRWWPWKKGWIVKQLNTRIYIWFNRYTTERYDKAHCQFLERVR